MISSKCPANVIFEHVCPSDVYPSATVQSFLTSLLAVNCPIKSVRFPLFSYSPLRNKQDLHKDLFEFWT